MSLCCVKYICFLQYAWFSLFDGPQKYLDTLGHLRITWAFKNAIG